MQRLEGKWADGIAAELQVQVARLQGERECEELEAQVRQLRKQLGE